MPHEQSSPSPASSTQGKHEYLYQVVGQCDNWDVSLAPGKLWWMFWLIILCHISLVVVGVRPSYQSVSVCSRQLHNITNLSAQLSSARLWSCCQHLVNNMLHSILPMLELSTVTKYSLTIVTTFYKIPSAEPLSYSFYSLMCYCGEDRFRFSMKLMFQTLWGLEAVLRCSD